MADFLKQNIFNIILYAAAIGFLILSFLKDRLKTKKALLKAWRSFAGLIPMLIGIIVVLSILLSIFTPEIISKLIGKNSGFAGTLMLAVIGAITLIPGFIAFPTAALLLQNGAGYMQIAAFISSLMMVGVITIPLEISYFNKKVTIIRNVSAFLFSIIVALIIGLVLK